MKHKISNKFLSFMLSVALVLSTIPFSSVPFASATTTNLSNFTNNTSLKVYAYQTDDAANRWTASGNGLEYTTATSTVGASGIWNNSNTLGKIADGSTTTYFLPAYATDMKARNTTVVVDLGAWFTIDSIQLDFFQPNGSRLAQFPATVYYSSASTIEEVRDYGFKSFYGTTRGQAVTATSSVTITKATTKVRFVTVDFSTNTQFPTNQWYTGPYLSELTVTGDDATKTTIDPNYVSVTSVSVANVPTFNLGDNVYKELETSGAVIKDQGGTTLSSLYKFEGLHTSTTGTRTAVAWIGPEASSIDVPDERKKTFSYTVNSSLNNVSLNQNISLDNWNPQMGWYGGSTTSTPYALFTGDAITTNSSNIRANNSLTGISSTTYYPFTPQALSEHLDNTKAFSVGVYGGSASTAVITSNSAANVGTTGSYIIVDLQKNYNIKMVQFTAVSNIIKPKLFYLTEAQGTNIITTGQKKVGTATGTPPAASPFVSTEKFNVGLLGTAVGEITSITSDLGSYNSKDTVVAFKSNAGQTPSLSGELSTSVNATPVVVTNSSVATTARYVIIQNQLTSSVTSQLAEIKVWADTVQTKLQLNKQILNKLLVKAGEYTQSNYATNSWSNFSSKTTAAQSVYNNASATSEQVDVATYDLFNSFINLDTVASASERNALEYQIDYANALTSSEYTPATWSNLQTVLSTATSVFNAKSSSKEVATETTNLQNAINNLVPINTKTELAAAISQAQALNQNDYTPTSWSTYYPTVQAKLTTATTVNSDVNATQLAIDTARVELVQAMNNLVLRANKTTLQQTINTANTKNSANYTLATWNSFSTALAAANTVNANGDATQAQVDTANTNLTAAMNNLVQIPLNISTSISKSTLLENDTVEVTVALDNYSSILSSVGALQIEVDYDRSLFTYVANSGTNELVLPKDTENITDVGGKSFGNVLDVTDTYCVATYYAGSNSSSVFLPLPKTNTTVMKFTLRAKTTITQDTNYTFNTRVIALTDETINSNQITNQTLIQPTITIMDGLIPVDKTALNSAITEATLKTEADYTPNSWAIFSGALLLAQSLAENDYSIQSEIDSATSALISATSELVKVKKFVITFVSDLNEPIASLVLAEGSTITPPTAPTKAGYTFTGYKTVTGGAFNSTVTMNVKYVANYTKNVADPYTVSVNGGTAANAGTGTSNGSTIAYSVKSDTLITLSAPATNGILVFANWSVNGKIVSYDKDFTTYVSGNVTYDAIFELAPPVPTVNVLIASVTEIATNKQQVCIQLQLPEGTYLYNTGLVISKTSNATLETSGVKDAPAYAVTLTNQFVSNVLLGSLTTVTQVYVRGYLIYGDGTGTRYTVYSDEIVLTKIVSTTITAGTLSETVSNVDLPLDW